MFRLRLNSFGRILAINPRNVPNQRHFSSQGSSKLKVSVVVGSGALAFTAFTLAYAKYDKQFADQLINLAPFLKSILEEVPDLKSNEDFVFPKKIAAKPLELTKSSIGKPENNPKPVKIDSQPEKPTVISNEKIQSSGEHSSQSLLKSDEENLRKELEKALRKKDEDQNVMEDEFRGQLKRLLYAFNEFYEEKRILHETESKRKQEIEVKNIIVQERAAIADEYENSFKKLKQMEKLLEIRDQLDKQEKASKKLWLLSQTLAKLLEHDRSLGNEIKPIDINEKIDFIREVVKDNFANETLIQTALDSLPENTVKNGIYSEEDLIRRFQNIEKICNRVALVSDEYTNIFGYLKSYAYSFIRPLLQFEYELSLNPLKIRDIPPEELKGEIEIDPNELDVYDILQRVNLCVQHRNFEMALRYANLLTGEPRNVAEDWIKDTREHLEVKQVLELVQTKIASINLHQLSFTDDVVGCGGFVVSSVNINYEPIKIKLYTDQGIIKYISDCAPNNGYYFIPLYDFGKYILRIEPPNGWIFEPNEVEFDFDGKNDFCSKQDDLNFIFKGFTIFGKIFSLNSLYGSKGVQVTLLSKANNNVIKQNITFENGLYEFHEVLPGQYIIEASHDRWKFTKNRIIVNVIDDNIDHRQIKNPSDQLCLLGYSVNGKVVSDGRPIRGAQFALFGQNKSPSTMGCNEQKPNFLSKLKIDSNYQYLCYTDSNEQGQFKFESLPNGKYAIYSYYETQNIRFEVKPHKYEFEIALDDLDLDVAFEIGGFSIFGQVMNSLDPDDIIDNIHIQFIDENNKYEPIKLLVKDSRSKFTIDNMKTSNYLIKTSADSYQFEDFKFLISPNSPNIPIIVPSKYEICVKIVFKNFEHKNENIELLVIEKETKTLKESFLLESENFCFFLSGGEYLLQTNTKYSNLKFIPSTLDLKVDKPKTNIIFEQMTVTLDGNINLKSPLNDESDFLTVLFSNNKMVLKTIHLDELIKKSDTQYAFVLDNLLPGEYFLSLGGQQIDYLCWQENLISVNINENKMANISFQQKGFLLQITLSHSSGLVIKSPNGNVKKIPQDSISQDRLVKYCAEERGKYSIETIGCHKFFLDDNNSKIVFDTETMAGQMISLTALRHLVQAKIISSVDVQSIKVLIDVESNEGEKQQKTITIKNGKRIASSKNLEFDLEFYEHPMSTIRIEPTSTQLIFKPTFFKFSMKDDCYLNLTTFYGRPGVFINGMISKPIANVKIDIYDNNQADLILQTVYTDEQGKYLAGPFDDEIDLRIEATKDDFVFKPIPEKRGFFEVIKLSSIITTIIDEDGNPLNEVLVSLSGGENNYRRNSFVNADGKLTFDNLHSGQYFIRFLRKEYEFNPSSKMFDLKNGDNMQIKIIGKKVAFSCIGVVDSLNGDPESGVIVEAVGIRNLNDNSQIQCTQLQEQSSSEIDGSFRILGLLPDCQYVIRLKNDILKNRNISKSIPKAHSVRLQNKDLTDLRFIVIYKFLHIDLTSSINVNEEYLNSMTIKLFREDETSELFRQSLIHPFVFLPTIPFDNRSYELHLESNLDKKLYKYQSMVHKFRANESYIHLDFDFHIEKRSQQFGLHEQEVTHNSIYSMILFLIIVAVYNYKQVQEFGQKSLLPELKNFIGKFNSKDSNNYHSNNDGSGGNSSENTISSNKNKKIKTKKS